MPAPARRPEVAERRKSGIYSARPLSSVAQEALHVILEQGLAEVRASADKVSHSETPLPLQWYGVGKAPHCTCEHARPARGHHALAVGWHSESHGSERRDDVLGKH